MSGRRSGSFGGTEYSAVEQIQKRAQERSGPPTLPDITPYSGWETSGIGWRAFALLVDTTICVFFAFHIFAVIFFFVGDAPVSELMATLEQDVSGNLVFERYQKIASLILIGAIGTWLTLLLTYGALTEGRWIGATFGKLILGLRVATFDGKQLRIRNALARNIYKSLFSLSVGLVAAIAFPLTLGSPTDVGIAILLSIGIGIIFVGYTIIDLLSPLFSSYNQTLHDRWGYSVVVKHPGINRWFRVLFSLLTVIGLGMILLASLNLLKATRLKPLIDHHYTHTVEPKKLAPNPQKTISIAESLPESKKKKITTAPGATPKIPHEEKPIVSNEELAEKSDVPNTAPVFPKDTYHKKKKKKPVVERASGSVKISSSSYRIKDAVAALSSDSRVIVLNLYDKQQSRERKRSLQNNFRSSLSDTNAVLRFKLLLSKYGEGCTDREIRKYFIDINTRRAGVKNKSPFFSVERSGSQIVSQEYLSFDCSRKKEGSIKLEAIGNVGFLIGGVRIPVTWNTKATARFKSG